MLLLVGLGNPGGEYRRNRHNIGFMVIDELARLRVLPVRQPQAPPEVEHRLAHVPAGTPLERYLDDEIDIEAAYRELLPPHKPSQNHGVGFLWEAQLIHPEYVDQEAQGDDGGLNPNDFARWR